VSALLTVLGVLLIAAFVIERLTSRHARHKRDHESRNNLRHITGSPPWWKDPPGDGPEGDH
jgi:hypothetical protein